MSRTNPWFKKSYLPAAARISVFAISVLFLIAFACQVHARQQAFDPAQTAEAGSGLYRSLEQSFDLAVETETGKLEEVSDRLKAVKAEQEEFESRISRLRLMTATHSNLLLLPEAGIHALERARIRQTVAAGYIQEQTGKTEKKINTLKTELEETSEQMAFYERQAKELQFRPPHVEVDRTLAKNLDALISILKTRQKKLEQILEIYTGRVERFKRLLPELESLSAKIDKQIEERKISRILAHTPTPVMRLLEGDLKKDLFAAIQRGRKWLFHTAWKLPDFLNLKEYLTFLSIFLCFLAVLEAVLYMAGRYLRRLMQQCLEADRFWQHLFVRLIQKSLLLAGAIAYIYFYPVKPVYRMAPVFVLLPLVIRIMVLVMVVQWGRVFFKAVAARTGDVLFRRLYGPIKLLLYGVMVYGAGYYFITRVVCYNCITLVAWRLLFEFLLLAWAIRFFVLFARKCPDSCFAERPWFKWFEPAFILFGFGLVLPGIAAELSGFGGLAVYWYNGLAKSAAVVFWTAILLRLLSESDVHAHIERSEDVDEDDLAGRQPYPVRWLLVRLFRLAGVACAVFMLVLAWGAPKTFLAEILDAVNYKITLGDFQLSLIGFVYALIVLLVIHTLAVITKEALRRWILKNVELEDGFKDSIVRITGYVLWAVGILVALRVVGVSATALTVVFGALGIGLGFGLQNIFNNFLSGIILLFERPIQVGDVIETGGILGTVREINVRSTQVRTFDNMDLIVPNSDFISQRLTNWSFRDARIRRTVEVGVAYGSDIELVRQILTDVAYRHPRILRRPHPEVLFSDFGESALIFRLRFWVYIDWFLTVETDVRFDIDKKFRENNITIPFPQRDLHFKSDNRALLPGTGAQEQET
ncbi:MAG: mechanosensitive ion channel [Desulfobacteraceae bacterium]|nr:mechanosensitive ion channel [Desulfobacteraceae bacterium]